MTLDDDLFASLQRLAQERGTSFKQVLNGTLRSGLQPPEQDRPAYRTPTGRLGLREGVDITKALRLVGELEDEEIVRKMELRK